MLVGRDPSDLKRGTSQVGTELTSPWTLWGGKVRPVAYADFQANARSNWRVASSVMAGLQFENARIGDRKLQVLAEYFSGPSPNGQFYTQNTEWFGLGIHLVLLIHPHFRVIDFVTPTSRANTPSVDRTIISTRMFQTRLSKVSDVSGGDQGKRNGEDTGLKRVMAVWKRDLSYNNCRLHLHTPSPISFYTTGFL